MAVILSLIERQKGAIKTEQICRQLGGWDQSKVRTYLSRLKESKRIQHVGRGLYAPLDCDVLRRPDGSLHLVVHGQHVIVPPKMTSRIHEMLCARDSR